MSHYLSNVAADNRAVLSTVLVGSPDPEIAELETQLRTAQLTADVAALNSLIADDLLFVGPDGRPATKRQDLEAHASGAGTLTRGTYCYTRVWSREGSAQWRVVGGHVSPLPGDARE